MQAPRPPAEASFIADLNELKRRAGNPSLGELVRHSNRKLAKSTINGHLSGQRVGLPAWRLVSAYVAACRKAAQSTGIDTRTLGTDRQWQVRWDAAFRGALNPPDPFVADPTEPIDDADNIEPAIFSTYSDDRGESTQPRLRQLLEEIQIRQKTLPSDAALLAIVDGSKFADLYELRHNITTIGRIGECDIWLYEPRVSRRHAQIRKYGDNFTIRDLGSTNGTFRGSRKIHTETFLRSYDELSIGPFTLLFVQGDGDLEGFKSQGYSSLQSNLIRNSIADTSEFRAIQ